MTDSPEAAPADAIAAATAAVAALPPARWAVGVSGGADSIALLLLLLDRRPHCPTPHVVHLDHETREGQSGEDARFVRELCDRLGVPCTIETRSTIESSLPPGAIQPNPSARFRAARLALYRRVVDAQGLAGVVLAHHADDQAETVLHRLLRGSGAAGLAGMAPVAHVGGLEIRRPLLDVRRASLHCVLARRGQPWREDASNASDDYLRNRLRRLLAARAPLSDALLRLGTTCRVLRDWVHSRTPDAGETLTTIDLLRLPAPLRRELARRWLAGRDVPEDRIDPGVIRRLLAMAEDASTPPRQHLPGCVLVRRRGGVLSARRAAARP